MKCTRIQYCDDDHMAAAWLGSIMILSLSTLRNKLYHSSLFLKQNWKQNWIIISQVLTFSIQSSYPSLISLFRQQTTKGYFLITTT